MCCKNRSQKRLRLFLWQNLNPAAVRILDEVEAHGGVIVHHAPHFVVELASFFHVGHAEGNVGVLAAIVVGFGYAFVPSKLQLKRLFSLDAKTMIHEPSSGSFLRVSVIPSAFS